jgi:hypothetical protein
VLLNRTRRLLGLARSTSAYRDWDDRLTPDPLDLPGPAWCPAADAPRPDWQADLESLFRHVDSRLAERRAVVSIPADGVPDLRQPAPSAPVARVLTEVAPPTTEPASKPKELWLGFGLEEPAPVVDEPGVVGELASQVVAHLRAALLDGEITAAVREAARDAVEDALRDRLGAEVRAGVEAALREESERRNEERRLSPSTIVSIRVRQRRWQQPA